MRRFLAAAALVGIASSAAAPPVVRVASFNTSLSPNSQAALAAALADPSSIQPRRIAEVIQRVAPDIILLNELNYDGTSAALDALHDNFIAVSQNGQLAQNYPHRFLAPSNTGVHSGLDFNNSGSVNANPGSNVYGDDCYGFGLFPGQFAMAVLSVYPIRTEEIRTLQNFLWKDMPGAVLPDISGTQKPRDWYNTAELEVFRLSSKSHWDVPIEVEGHVVHLLGSHPTPPTFDGAENRNGLRNHDEIRLWADYIDPARDGYIYDDNGVMRGLGAGHRFVICGDQNADPFGGDSFDNAARQFTEHPLIDASVVPSSSGGGTDTASFAGGLRVDYVLPSRAGLRPIDGRVFWPATGEEGRDLIAASDHRLVYMDLEIEPMIAAAVPDLEVFVEGADLVLRWSTLAAVAYSVQVSSSLAEGDWMESDAILTFAEGVVSARIVGVVGAGNVRFFRVGAEFE